jgi:hypothetical protein
MTNFSFPGFSTDDNILSFLKLMTSKNPDNDIEANIVFEGGYKPCNGDSKSGNQGDLTAAGCDPGYLSDTESMYCYMVLPDLMTYLSGDDMCLTYSNGTILYFENDNQVRSFHKILSTGKIIKYFL